MSDITQRGAIIRDDNNVPVGYNYVNITSQTTTLVKTGAGFLHSIVFNKPAAGGTAKIVDGVTDTTPVIGTITSPATTLIRVCLIYDVAFTTGLTIVTGTANQDITVSYI